MGSIAAYGALLQNFKDLIWRRSNETPLQELFLRIDENAIVDDDRKVVLSVAS